MKGDYDGIHLSERKIQNKEYHGWSNWKMRFYWPCSVSLRWCQSTPPYQLKDRFKIKQKIILLENQSDAKPWYRRKAYHRCSKPLTLLHHHIIPRLFKREFKNESMIDTIIENMTDRVTHPFQGTDREIEWIHQLTFFLGKRCDDEWDGTGDVVISSSSMLRLQYSRWGHHAREDPNVWRHDRSMRQRRRRLLRPLKALYHPRDGRESDSTDGTRLPFHQSQYRSKEDFAWGEHLSTQHTSSDPSHHPPY